MRLILLLIISLSLSACSMDRMLVRSSVPLIEGGVEALNHETDLDLAEDPVNGSYSGDGTAWQLMGGVTSPIPTP